MTSRKSAVVKYCAYALLLIAAYVLQSSRGTSLSLWGLKIDVVPYFVMALALFEGPYAAGCFGFAAGLLCVVSSPAIDGLLALYYGLLGALCGAFALRYMRPILPSALLLGLLASTIQGVFGYLFYYALLYGAPLGRSALLLLGNSAISLVPAALVFFAVRGIYLRFAEKDEE